MQELWKAKSSYRRPPLDMPSQECFGFADTDGLLEPLVDLGAELRKGDVIARVHSVTRTGAVPQEYRAALDGILAARHFPGLIKMGDCLSVIATISGEPASG